MILGGSIWKAPDGRWQTNGLDEPGDIRGITFDRFRVIAASHLFRDAEILIIASGGEATEDQPSIARVIRDELVSLGVPEEWIIEEDQSKDTHQQLRGVCEIIKERSLVEVRLISNEWHVSRIQAMIECSHALDILRQIRWALVSAEEVLLSRSLLDWGPTIQKMRFDPRTAQRIALEKKGELEIREGTYKFR